LAVACCLAQPIIVHAADRPPCEASDDAAGVVAPLPHVAAVLKPGSKLEVLAVGSATLFGPGISLPVPASSDPANTPPKSPPPQLITEPASDLAFPNQMARVLELEVPGLHVHVTIRGGRGLSATDMVKLIRGALAESQYQLVLWQTGTVEAVRNVPPGEFAQTLAEGAEAVQQGNADLVLIDPQYSRFLQANSNLDPYEQAFQQVSSMTGVVLFRRFDLMRAWVNDGQIDLERTPRANRRRMVELLHTCLGAQLARMVIAGARS
jgi:hypothetical protein